MSFDNLDTWWLLLRSAILVAAFLAFAWALLAQRRDASSSFMRLASQHDQAIAEIHRLAEKISELAAQVHDLSLPSPMTSQRLAAVAPSPPPPPTPLPGASSHGRGYEMAIRMARGGATVEDIVASCGTPRAEARLLRRLHCANGATAA
ncbi:MAG: DUF2802 domain-containing protein [Steroidobacteraceae bacterium]|nr:DUF2802 domain-containing protein [Steroidobacteraceae bacterium]